MTEQDYIVAGDLARVRVALDALRPVQERTIPETTRPHLATARRSLIFVAEALARCANVETMG